ncbi:MAG: tetratricopeptide repeat protein [Anaerolineae bacterium]|nr:tetratricopeptide repeat protein [Anaerolineae bacterium]
MNTFTSRDYELNQEYRNRQMAAAEPHTMRPEPKRPAQPRPAFSHRAIVIAAFLILAAVLLVASPRAEAQDRMNRADAGASVGSPVELALILGDYYYDHGQYDQAVAEFSKAVELMPERLFELMPAQSVVYWHLGEAQEQAGQSAEALISYQRYLQLAGAGATDYAVRYVQTFAQSLDV